MRLILYYYEKLTEYVICYSTKTFRLLNRYLNMEIELIRANERSEIVEKKLRQRTDELDATRKELASVKKELEKLKNMPYIHSESLKVITIRYNFIRNCVLKSLKYSF